MVYLFVPYQLGPILGLLGTLIPLGPGLAALGSGDIVTLAEALTVAFDTTVTGLVIGALAYLVSLDDDPMSGLSNLSDAMLVLALGFLIFAIMALSANPELISQTPDTQDVSSADTFEQNYTDAGGMEDSGYSEVGKVYEDPTTGKLVLVSE